MAEASGSRTHLSLEQAKDTSVLKTGTITGPHALPRTTTKCHASSAPFTPPTQDPSEARSSGGSRSVKFRVNPWPILIHLLGFSCYLGCAVTRKYGLMVLNPGNLFSASSFETFPPMMTSSPGFQFAGVETECLAVS